jgi:glycolate oxidase FAD binding subunit
VTDTFRPTTADEVRDTIAWAVAEERPLELVGSGTKRALGRPVEPSAVLDLSAIAGVVDYDPPELVLTAAAGTGLAKIETLLEENGQMLAFEPADLGLLLAGPSTGGADADRRPVEDLPVGGTLGGAIACNLSGPRRIVAGAARDHCLGIAGVSGRGEVFKGGGKVVKNVTGYDLPKLMCGSYGTLAALTEITVKVLPAPEKTRTVLVLGADDAAAVALLTGAAAGEAAPSALAHLPAEVAARSSVGYVSGAGGAVTALRLEGAGPSVEARCAALRTRLGRDHGTEELHGHNSARLWREIRDVTLLPPAGAVWRVSVPPAEGAQTVARLRTLCGGDAAVTAFYDWSGGLIWLAVDGAPDGGHRDVRGALGPSGGHATLIRAAEAVRASVPVFHPQPTALAALAARVKNGFDPRRVLNRGRMTPGV